MVENPHLKVLVASGYYDLATAYRATEYTLAHMKLDPAVRRNHRGGEFHHVHEILPAAPVRRRRLLAEVF